MSYVFFQNKYPGYFTVPVRVFNQSGKSKVIDSMVDTGSWSLMDGIHALDLGIDVTRGYHKYTRGEETYYLHKLPIQIGNLKPVIADIYFGSKAATFAYLKKSALEKGTIGWANNGGLANYIMDIDISTLSFTDYSFIHSLPIPVNNYTTIGLSPPRLSSTGYKEEILYNQQPYHDITFFNKRNGAPVTVKMAIDTGATWTLLKNELAPALGINIESGKKMESVIQGKKFPYYIHEIVMKLGTLAPKKVTVNFADYESNLFGQDNLYRYRVRFLKDRIIYEENPSSIWF